MTKETEAKREEATSYEMSFRCVGAYGGTIEHECKHKWIEILPIPMRVDVFARRVKSITCPRCNSRNAEFYIEIEK
jgi:hypothetical protein